MSQSRSVAPEASAATSIDHRILEAVAEREGTSPVEFDTPLWDVVDPDALEALFRSEDAAGRVSFTYLGHRVHVYSDGRIALTDADE